MPAMNTKHTPTPWTLAEGQCFANTICLDAANHRPVSLNLAQAARDAIEFAADRERKLVAALRREGEYLAQFSGPIVEELAATNRALLAELDKVQS